MANRVQIVAGVAAISSAGLLLISGFEGKRMCAYPDPGTRGAPWTIGYGHTGPEVRPGLCISKEQADALLLADIRIAQTALAPCVRVPVSENERDGLTAWTLNVGGRNACGSTLVRKLNSGDYAAAAAEFPRWNRANGQVMPGLTRRRRCEQRLFLTPPNQAPTMTAEAVKACILA